MIDMSTRTRRNGMAACVAGSLLIGLAVCGGGVAAAAEEAPVWQLAFEQKLSEANLISDWLAIAGTWERTADGAKMTGADNGAMLLLRKPIVFGAMKIEYEARADGPPGDLSLVLGTDGQGTRRCAFFGAGSRGNQCCKILFAHEERAVVAAELLKPDTWHTITATREGGRLTLAVDGKQVLTAADNPHGLIGSFLALYAWNPATFRSIKVWRRDDPELEKFLRHRGKIKDSVARHRVHPYTPDHYASRDHMRDYIGYLKNGVRSFAPVRWIPPDTFDIGSPGLGLPVLPGIEHTVIYDPKLSKANMDEGGSGKFESLAHGEYNHHSRITLYKDKIIVHWTNHSLDENGPGQRMLGRVGTFNADGSAISWGGDETLVELAPSPVPVRRRLRRHDPDKIYEISAHGNLVPINESLYFFGHFTATHGYVNDLGFRQGRPGHPIPAEKWSDNQDPEKGFATGDVFWNVGFGFIQKWKFEGDRLIPDSPIYKTSEMVDKLEVTPGRFKQVEQAQEPYRSAKPLSEAPEAMRQEIKNGRRHAYGSAEHRSPRYDSPDASRLAADGLNGLAHGTEFRRPDGKWVAIRDNLLRGGCYYAAVKDDHAAGYPPAIRTNLIGDASPIAGELPDGRPWLVGIAKSRTEMYLALSEDGIVFDKTWLVMHREVKPSGGDRQFSAGGPSYFQYVIKGDVVWFAYSIGKTQEGVTRMPLSSIVKAAEAWEMD